MRKGNPETPEASAAEALGKLAELEGRIDAALRPIAEELQSLLSGLAGKSFGSLEENKLVTSRLTALLARLGKRVRCPKEGCGAPAILRRRVGPRHRSGVFQFEHFIAGRQISHLGSATLPELRLVEPSPDRRQLDPEDPAETGKVITTSGLLQPCGVQ